MSTWFIDALDARAGTAFASYRGADLDVDQQDLEVLSVQIAPPDFQVKTLAGRAVGLAATRSSFQLGLFSNGGEIGFSSLDVLISFVRRVYVTSGGGDGAAGGGGVPPMPPDAPDGGGGPGLETTLRGERPYWGETPSQVDQMFASAAAAVRNLDFSAGGKEATPIQYAAPSYGVIKPQHGDAERAALAFVEIGAELIQRCPDDATDVDLPGWWASMGALAQSADRLGLWRLAADKPLLPLLEYPARWLLSKRRQLLLEPWEFNGLENHGSFSADQFARFRLLLLMDPPAWRGHVAWFISDADLGEVANAFPGSTRLESPDRFDDLGHWPLPMTVRSRHHLDPRASVADFLAIAAGASPSFSSLTPIECGILLLAVGHLTCQRGISRHWNLPSAFIKGWQAATFAEAMRWLAAQMPDKVFPTQVENIIKQSISCQYAS